jgi:hypothetical protein
METRPPSAPRTKTGKKTGRKVEEKRKKSGRKAEENRSKTWRSPRNDAYMVGYGELFAA